MGHRITIFDTTLRDGEQAPGFSLTVGEKLQLDLIAAYRKYEIDWMGDGDQMPIDLNHTYVLQTHDQTSVEGRLSGAAIADRLAWTVGAYYYDDSSHLGGYVTLPAFAIILPNFNQNDTFTTKSKSAFAHGDFKVTDRFSLIAGVRYTDESKVYNFDHSPYLLVPTPLNYGSSHTDWKISANFRFSDAVMVYGQAATGFRSDGAQPRPFTVGQQKEVVPAEELISYEIGAKTDLFNRKLRLNLAAFFEGDAERGILLALPARRDAQHQAPARQRVQGGGGLGQQARRPERRDQNAR